MKAAPIVVLSSLALSTLGLAGCVNPYQVQPQQAVLPPPLPYYTPPTDDSLPPVVFQPLAPPQPAYTPLPPPPEDTVLQPEAPPPLAVEVPAVQPANPEPAPPAIPAATPVATPAAVQAPPGPDKGNVPLMGFRPMRGQKAPGA